ncbi:MAG: hypothetical protein U1F36_02810 [Planctomycetota bacterium]
MLIRPALLPTRPILIRAVTTVLLLALLTALMLVGAWAGLQAWPKSAPPIAGADHDPALPAPLQKPRSGPLPKVPAVIEAGFAKPMRPGTAPLQVEVAVNSRRDELAVAVLDAGTGATLRDVELPGDGSAIRFDDLPDTRLQVVLHARDQSPRFAWLTRSEVAAGGERQIRLEAELQSVVLRLKATRVDANRRFVPITAHLRRVDDPTWGNTMLTPVALGFAPGSADLDLALPSLPAGRYRVEFDGFAPRSQTPIEVVIPSPSPIEVAGEPL